MNERFNELYRVLFAKRIVFSQADFARQIGKTRGTMSQMINGTASVSRNTIETICEKFPMVNKVWLLTGEGTMFNDAVTPSVSIQNVGNVKMENSQNVNSSPCTEELAALRAENKALKEQVEWLRSMLQK